MKIVMTVELGKPNTTNSFQNMVIRMVADLCTMLNHTQTEANYKVLQSQYKIADAEYEVVQ